MTAKEYLQRYLDTDREINCRLDEIRHLRDLSTKTTQAFLPEEKQSTASLVAKIVDMEKEVDAAVDLLIEIKHEIEETIRALPDHRYREVLLLRYINGKLWREIADELSYSDRNLTYLHNQALKEIADRIA
jgi:Sigma-70, region 4.